MNRVQDGAGVCVCACPFLPTCVTHPSAYALQKSSFFPVLIDPFNSLLLVYICACLLFEEKVLFTPHISHGEECHFQKYKIKTLYVKKKERSHMSGVSCDAIPHTSALTPVSHVANSTLITFYVKGN